jgi:hypothetical protein
MKLLKLLPLFTSILLVTCSKSDEAGCFESAGKVQRTVRFQGEIRKILLRDGINLIFTEDSIPGIEIEGGKNILPGIKTEFSGDSLIIQDKNYCNWVRDPESRINIYIKGQKNIRLYNKGYGKVEGRFIGDTLRIKSWSNETTDIDVQTRYFWLESFKLGNTNIKGRIVAAEIFRHETGIVKMDRNMNCSRLIYHDHGQGKSYVKADDSAIIELFDSGNTAILSRPAYIFIREHKSGKVSFE